MVLPFPDKLSRNLRTRLKNSISENLPFFKIRVFLNLQHVFLISSSSKIKWPFACPLTSFPNFRVVDAMLPVTAKHARI